MGDPQVVRELKSDSFGRIELMDGPAGWAVRRVACGGRVPGSRLVARALMNRERRALARLEGVPGVTQLLDLPEYARAPSGAGKPKAPVLLRSWIEGVPLWSVHQLPIDFFEQLAELVRELHARGVCHNDLHKEPNVLVDDRGFPALVDFQLASLHRAGSRRLRVRAVEDLAHVEKHRRVYARGTGMDPSPDRTRMRRRRSLLARAWMALGKPLYNLVTRRLLHRSDGEPRRPSSGPWPEWTPPVGPRPRRGRTP